MTTECWQSVLETFERVYFDTPAESREEELERLCAGREDVATEVRRLISAADAPGPLDRPLPIQPSGLAWEGDPAGTFTPGRRVGNRYLLIRLLGEGGMGQVWEAFDEQLETRRALKTLRPEIAADPEMIARFKREVERAQAVTHPNVCRVHDLNFEGATPYLSMELIEGETLAAWLRRATPPSRADVWKVLRDCAGGIDAAHSAGLVHRDLKPGNVMVVSGAGGIRAVVMDFGLAFYSTDSARKEISFRGAGTPAYMPPEQSAGETPTRAADLYAFGVLACEALTGKRPSDGGLPVLPAFRRRAIRRCLDADPARRPPSAASFLSDLDGRARRRNFLLAAFAGLALCAAAGWGWKQRQAASELPDASVAILPFEIAGGGEDPTAIAEGISEGVVSLLARAPGLRVVPRASTEMLAKATGRLEEFARRARARYVLTGRLRIGERIQLRAEMVDLAANRTIWAGAIEEPESRLADLELKLAVTMLAQMGAPTGLSDWNRRQTLPEAARAYRIARHHLNRRTSESMHKAREYFEAAIRLDPRWAEPQVGLAQTLMIEAERQDVLPQQALPEARDRIQEAIRLDSGLAEAHAAAGFLAAGYEHNFDRAEASFRRALVLDPNNVTARQWHAYTLARRADFVEALRESQAALDLDPLSSAAYQGHAAILLYARDWNGLLAHLDKLAELHPESYYYRILRAYALASTGAAAAARAELAAAMNNPPVMTIRLAGEIYAMLGDRAAAAAMAQELETRRAAGAAVPASYIAFLYAAMDNPNEAFRWLEQAWTDGDPFLTMLGVYPSCDRLRGDPRYRSLMGRLGL